MGVTLTGSPIDEDLTGTGLIQAGGETREGRFPAPGWSHDGDALAGLYV